MKLEPVYVWVAGTVKQAMAKLSRSLTPFHIGTPRDNQGDRAGNASALPAGKVAWEVDPDTHDGTSIIAADVFFAEYDAKKREVYMLDDISGARHPGAKPLKRGFNIEILNGENRSGKGIVYRTAEYGSEGIAKNIFQHATADLIAHHLHPNPPDNSSQVYDPDSAGRHGGLHYPLRVREWLRKFCSGKTASDIEVLFAPLFNLGRNGDGTPAYGAAHWDRSDGTLSDEGGGPLANADDNNHILGITGDAKVNQGALNIDALHGPIRKLYGPEELVNQQWEAGSKGPYIKQVDKRPDFDAKHRNFCGRKVPLVIKWQTWSDTNTYQPKDPTPAPEKVQDPTPASEKGPITGPPNILKDPTPNDPKGSTPPGIEPPGAMQKVIAPLPRPGTTSPGQVETPSVQGHAEPALPDGPMTGRSSKSPYEQAWLNRFGWTEVEFVKQPLGADLVAVPQYQSATPNDNATGADRWEPKYSQEAVFTVDKDGRVTSRDQIATGSGDFAIMPAKSNPKHLFVENKGSIEAGEDVSGLFVLSVNNGTNGIAGWFGIGSRLITGGLASGMKVELDFSSDADNPDTVFTARDEDGAQGTGDFDFVGGTLKSNGVAVGLGTGDVTGPSSAADNGIVLFNGTTGKIIKDSGIAVSDLATADPDATSTAGNLVSYRLGDGRSLEDSGIAKTNVALNSDNLSELTNAAAARTNIGAGDVSASANLSDGTVVVGDGGAKGVKTTGVAVSPTDEVSGVTSLTIDGADDAQLVELANDATHGERTYIGEVATSNASSTTLLEFARPSASATIAVEYVITAVNRDATTQRYIQKAVIEYYDNAGTLTVNGTPIEDHNNDTLTITGVSAGVNGSNIQINVMGNASKTILWGIVARVSWRNTTA